MTLMPSSALAHEPPAPSGQAAVPVANSKFLFEMIVADLHGSALQTAALCMMATACSAPEARFSLHACRHIAYDDTRVMRLALRYGESVGLAPDMRQRLDRLYAELADMQKQIEPFVGPQTLSSSERSQLARIVPAFRRIAVAASEALSGIEAAARARLNPNYVEDAAVLRAFLGRAARGETKDVDRFGVLTPPRLKQRRQSPRAPVNRPCRLVCGGVETEATMVDVSRQGLGLVCRAAPALGQTVEVRVGERRLEAVVARLEGEQIGLTLKRPLPFIDPLFQAG